MSRVLLLHQNPASLRRFQLAAIYTAATGQLLARVLNTSDGIVVAAYISLPDGAWDARESILRGEHPAINWYRKTDQIMAVIPLSGRLGHELPLSSQERQEPYIVTEEDILRRIGCIPHGDGSEFSREVGLRFG